MSNKAGNTHQQHSSSGKDREKSYANIDIELIFLWATETSSIG